MSPPEDLDALVKEARERIFSAVIPDHPDILLMARLVERLSPSGEEEVAFWRSDAAARLWFARGALTAEVKEHGYSDTAADIMVSRIMPTLAALKSALAGDLHECCEMCGKPLLTGQKVWASEDTSPIHESCAPGLTAADTTDPDGPDPVPYDYEGFSTPEQIEREIAETEAAREQAYAEPDRLADALEAQRPGREASDELVERMARAYNECVYGPNYAVRNPGMREVEALAMRAALSAGSV